MGDQKAEECKIPDTATGGSLRSSSWFTWKHTFSPLQLRFLSAFWILMGLVTLLISVSTEHWMGDGRLSVGLWSACMQPACAADEEGVKSGKETIQVTGSMLIVAVFFACVSFVLIGVSFFRHRIYSFSAGRIAAIASFTASIFVMIGMSVYTHKLSKMEDLVLEAEWSFDAGWSSFALLVLAGIVAVTLSCVES